MAHLTNFSFEFCLGAVANYRHFVSNERCLFELKPPSPSSKRTHTLHALLWKKCWPRNAGIVYMMRYAWWCPALRSISGKACHVSGSIEGLFSCFFLSGVGAYLPPFVLSTTDSASDGARSRRSWVSSDWRIRRQTRAWPWGIHVSEVCNTNTQSVLVLRERNWYYHDPARENLFMKFVILWISSSPKRPGSHAEPHAAVKNADFSSKRTSFDPPPSQTNIVRLKQNAGNWRPPLMKFSQKMPLYYFYTIVQKKSKMTKNSNQGVVLP